MQIDRPRLLQKAGVIRLSRYLNRHKVVILMVHGVVDYNDSHPWVPLRPHIDLEDFRAQIDALGKYYNWVSYSEAVEILAGRREPVKNAIAISFDDGYLNNVTYALPVLAERGIVPAFFVPTGFVNNQKAFWFDKLDYAFQSAGSDFEVAVGDAVVQVKVADRDSLRAAFAKCRALAKAADWTDEEFSRFVLTLSSRLESESGTSIENIQDRDAFSSIVSGDVLQELANSGEATIGSHTVDHVRVSMVPEQECEDQLLRSKRELENMTGFPCEHFCFPNGDNDSMSRAVAAKVGYYSSCTTKAGLNSIGCDIHALKRIHLSESFDEPRLLMNVSGLGQAKSALKSLIRRDPGA